MITVRCLLAIVATQNWSFSQLDVNSAFLHGDLHEEIYMSPPSSLWQQGENLVCLLNKSLYGLKQASRQWFAKFTKAFLVAGFIQSKVEYYLFTCKKGPDPNSALESKLDPVLVRHLANVGHK
ncbi:hypothetical protein L3X38_025498 [Prunus dulcis]|uniref:Reverse transcriptase Ty1/copia-type domain-containing protein n=1 Tax=Prunus dulcis TaxID=3755 RepID=A0AAD4Z741_PRUDU|nr:hypothetical protein L3X38_025498 [Prunus dulcis]